MTEHHDPELERMVAASLGAHADDAETAVPVAARARAAVRRRRSRWIAAGAAAAVAAVALAAVALDRTGPPERSEPPAASPPASSPSVDPGWRREYWHDVSVEVPVGWGWGTAPTEPVPGDGPLLCGGPGAMRSTEGRRLVNPDPAIPYVGRPIMLSDACFAGRVRDPQAPYVWLGAEVPVGTTDVGNGYTEETVRVGGTTVTVGTDDPALGERILASASVGGPCPPRLDDPPSIEPADDGTVPRVESLLVCAYRDSYDGSSHPELVYANELGAPAAVSTLDAIRVAPTSRVACQPSHGGEWVTLTVRGGGASATSLVDLSCAQPTVVDADGRLHRLTQLVVGAWAVDGLPVTLHGPIAGLGPMFEHFIGALG